MDVSQNRKGKVATEYRLAVKHYFHKQPKTFKKRDLEHAEKGVADSYRDFKRSILYDDSEAWVETRTVTEWQRID